MTPHRNAWIPAFAGMTEEASMADWGAVRR